MGAEALGMDMSPGMEPGNGKEGAMRTAVLDAPEVRLDSDVSIGEEFRLPTESKSILWLKTTFGHSIQSTMMTESALKTGC